MAFAIFVASLGDLAGVDALHVGGHGHRALAVQVLDARRTLVHA